jgi:4-diphosphocytidyl-2-C-methyl-D-erythritol kinase
MSRNVELLAHAKINWGLEVLARRPDGFHEIRTIAQTITLADSVTVAEAPPGIRIVVDGEWEAPTGPGNICWRAAETYMAAFGAPGGVSITLRKRVPPGGGLGGGSADGVAVLVGLAQLCGVGREALTPLAARLGSDTVLFLTGGTLDCQGRGEVVAPLATPGSYHLVVARPACAVSTPEAYGWLDPAAFTGGETMQRLGDALAAGAPAADLAALLVNAFTAPVVQRRWEVGALLEALRDAGALASQMTGSGSACFGLARDADHAAELAVALAAVGYWSVAARTTREGIEIARH